MIIRCVRAPADKPASILVSPTTPNVAVLRELGRQAIDATSPLTPVEQNSIYRDTAAIGQLAEVHDAVYGTPWHGLCTGVRHGMTQSGELRTVTRFLK